MRRLAQNRAREEERRARREHGAARDEAMPSTLDSAARIEVLHRLLAAVNRLEAPYRDAIVLRYFDDLPPRDIAARLGIPVNTARTHVRRGIERLRADLDPGSERERAAFLSALVPLLGPGTGIRVHALPGAGQPWRRLVQHPLVLASSVLLLGTLAWFVGRPNDPELALGSGNLAALAPGVRAPADPLRGPAKGGAIPPESSEVEPPAASGRTALVNEWTVRGHVERNRMAPHPGARLVGRLFAGSAAAGPALVEERFVTDANGDFAWSPTPPAAGLFTLEITGDMPAHEFLAVRSVLLAGDAAPKDCMLFSFPHDATVRGTVRGPDGAPLANAFVALSLGDEARAVRSASDGTFELGLAASRRPRVVCAWAAGLAPAYATLRGLAAGATFECALALEAELVLHGTVRGPDGGPLAGAEVVIQDQIIGAPASPSGTVVRVGTSSDPLLGRPWPRVTSGADGRYSIGGVHPGASSVVLRANAPGLRPAQRSCPSPATAGADDQDLELTGGVTLTGRVLAAGAPVEAAWISVGDKAGALEDLQAWCDAEGRFTLASVPAGAQHLWVARRGFAPLRHDVDVNAGTGALELELEPAHSVAGLVLGPDGAPRSWAMVTVKDPSGAKPERFSPLTTYAGPDGRFRVADLPAGPVALRVGAAGCDWLMQEVALDSEDLVLRLVASAQAMAAMVQQAPLPAAPPIVPVTSASGGASLGGRLLDFAGNGRAGESIELAAVNATAAAGPWHATTDANGEFVLGELPAGSFDVRWVRREGELTVPDLETRLTLSDHEARRIELQPRGHATLQGRFELLTRGSASAGQGKPPRDMPALAVVRLERVVDGVPVPASHRGTFAHEGRFELEGLEAGLWHLEAELSFGEGNTSLNSMQVAVPAHGTTETVVQILQMR